MNFMACSKLIINEHVWLFNVDRKKPIGKKKHKMVKIYFLTLIRLGFLRVVFPGGEGRIGGGAVGGWGGGSI